MADRSFAARGHLGAQRALLVAVDTGDVARPVEAELDELQALAEAAGAAVVDRIVQRRARVDPSTLFGSGKAREVAGRVAEIGAGLLIVLNQLRQRQRRALEKIVPVPIVDRTMVILDVFARHARSREGKLQVELAQLRYRQSNLIGIGADLSRLGGGIGTRGPGETKLETDRRRIAQRIATLNRRLADVRRQRATRRRASDDEPLVALVGYTNVGKTSLLNRLARSDALVADQPFATLDPMVRRAWLAEGCYVRLADTVGFITDLPAELVNAFRATLEELDQADLLLRVADAAHPDWRRQLAAVDATLSELGLHGKPSLTIFNKSDAAPAGRQDVPGSIRVSALTGAGIDRLKRALRAALPGTTH